MSTPQLSRIRVQRIAEEAVERARLRVVPRTRVRAPKVPFVMLVSAILLAGVIGLLMFNTTMQQNSFVAADLQQQADAARAEKQALEKDLDDLANPQRIALEADRLGMVVPSCPRFLYTATSSASSACAGPAERLDVAPPAARRPESLVAAKTIVEVQPKPKKWQLEAARRKAARASTEKTADTRAGETAGGTAPGSNGSTPN